MPLAVGLLSFTPIMLQQKLTKAERLLQYDSDGRATKSTRSLEARMLVEFRLLSLDKLSP
jgi:hypothetical protein